jgi:hypothetical protein
MPGIGSETMLRRVIKRALFCVECTAGPLWSSQDSMDTSASPYRLHRHIVQVPPATFRLSQLRFTTPGKS